MFRITRKRMAGMLLALAMSVVLVLVLATVAFAEGPIVHRVHIGGPDFCYSQDLPPGCDKNFSLSAREYADGSVRGQYSDQWGLGIGGFHAEIDCLSVDGNEAWVSGVITQGVYHDPDTGEDLDLAGLGVSTRMRDNGTSRQDPPDQISWSVGHDYQSDLCTEQPDYPLFDVPQGQVKVE